MISNKRSQSQIISTVILILLVLATATIIFSFALPFVKDRLSSGNCLDVVGKVGIDHNPKYTCYVYDTEEPPALTGVKMKIQIEDVSDLIDGFNINLGGADSETLEIIDGATIDEVDEGAEIELPGDNEARTYVIAISDKPDDIKVYPVLKGGKVCGVEDSILSNNIDDCI